MGESGSYNIGLTQTFNSRLQPVNLTASTPGGSVLNLTYGFNLGSSDNGNVMSITNNRDTTRSQTFTYDSLNRIATGSTGATSDPNCWGVNFNIDGYGNLQSTTALSGYLSCTQYFLSLSVSASTNQITGFGYDAAGNTTNDGPGGYTYTYDAEGHQLSAGGVNYSYDGDGRRVKKDNGTLYWYALSGNVLTETDLSGNNLADYIYFGGSRLARVPSSGPYYYLGDALGSSRVKVQGGQNSACYEADFEPYGRPHEITNTCSQHYKFTGMEQDSETSLNAGGNDHTWFRQYPPNLGRWLSPDPLAGDITNPQSLNRYAYVLNNPTTFVDPLGLKNVCDEADPTNAKVLNFIRANQASAELLAASLGCPVQDILGLARQESTFGTSPIAQNANNFFGLKAGAPGSTGTYTTKPAHGKGVKVSSFPASNGFAASGQSFVDLHGDAVSGISDPNAFAQGLVDAGFNTGNAATGGNPNFVNAVTGAIKAIQSRINCPQLKKAQGVPQGGGGGGADDIGGYWYDLQNCHTTSDDSGGGGSGWTCDAVKVPLPSSF